jgi:hypothetical protein
MSFYAGFAGIRQDTETMALRPEISYLIIDKTPEKVVEGKNGNGSGSDSISFSFDIDAFPYETIIDKHRVNCISDYSGKRYNIPHPIFQPDSNSSIEEGKEAFKKWLQREVQEAFPERKKQENIYIYLTIGSDGRIKFISLPSWIGDDSFNETLEEIIFQAGPWQPARIQGKEVEGSVIIHVEV